MVGSGIGLARGWLTVGGGGAPLKGTHAMVGQCSVAESLVGYLWLVGGLLAKPVWLKSKGIMVARGVVCIPFGLLPNGASRFRQAGSGKRGCDLDL